MHFRSVLRCWTAATVLSLSAGAGGAEAGKSVPNCALASVGGGQKVSLQQYRGKVLYVDFWASWCGPCAQSFPFMNKLHHELHNRGLQIVGINLDEDPTDATGFLAKRPVHFDVVADGDKRCAHDFGVKAMPSTYLVDRKGMIRHVHLGFRPGEAEEVRTLVEQLLAEGSAAH